MHLLKTECTVDGVEYVARWVKSGVCTGCIAQGEPEKSMLLCRALPVCHSHHKQLELSEFIIWVKKAD